MSNPLDGGRPPPAHREAVGGDEKFSRRAVKVLRDGQKFRKVAVKVLFDVLLKIFGRVKVLFLFNRWLTITASHLTTKQILYALDLWSLCLQRILYL